MELFKNLKPTEVSPDAAKRLRQKIISNLEDAKFSPYKGLDTELEVIDSNISLGYYASYEIFNESRSNYEERVPTSETIESYSPNINKENVDNWSYQISPNTLFDDHEVQHNIEDSTYVKECYSCHGNKEVDCRECSGNGQCKSCSGRGEKNCKCGNGNCDWCAGRGEVQCGSCKGSGRNIHGEDCSKCNGSTRTECSWCDGTGKHDACKGTGKLKCNMCDGTGNCTNCKGKGKITCETCNGRGLLKYYLVVKSTYFNSIEFLQLLNHKIQSFNPISIPDISGDVEVIKEITENEFSQDVIGNASDIKDIKDYLQARKSGYSEAHILQERIKIICVPVVSVNYTLNNKEYTSYFIGEKEQHFYKSSPLKDYSEEVDNQIKDLIENTNLPDAISLLSQQISRYEALEDSENVKRCTDLISELKIGIQKDQMKGAFYAQIVFSLIDLMAMYTLVSICGIKYESNAIFFVLALALIFVRIGFYFKHLVPLKLFGETDNAELNKYFNGDGEYSYYMFDTPLLKALRVIGIIGLFGFIVFSIDGNLDLITSQISIGYLIYTLFFGISLLTTMMLDIGTNRKVTKILEIKSGKLRMLRALSINTSVYSVIGLIVLLIAGLFVSDEPADNYSAKGESVANGLTAISYYFYSFLILGVLSYLISGGHTKQLKHLKVNANHKAGFLNFISKHKKKLKIAGIVLGSLLGVMLVTPFVTKFYYDMQADRKREEMRVKYYETIKEGDAAFKGGNMQMADQLYSDAFYINADYRVDDAGEASGKMARLDSLLEEEKKAQEEAERLAEEEARIKAEEEMALLADTLADTLVNYMHGYIGEHIVIMDLTLHRIYDDSIRTFDYNVKGKYSYSKNSGGDIDFSGKWNARTNRMVISVEWDDGPETFDGVFYNGGSFTGDWELVRKDGNSNLKFDIYNEDTKLE